MLIVFICFIAAAALVAVACCKVSGDCSREEERQALQESLRRKENGENE